MLNLINCKFVVATRSCLWLYIHCPHFYREFDDDDLGK